MYDIKETERRQYEGHNTPLGYCTDQGPQGCGQYDGQYDGLGEYCGAHTASSVFLILLSTVNIPILPGKTYTSPVKIRM